MDLNDSKKVLEICKPYQYEILLKNELTGFGKTAKEIKLDSTVNVMYIMQVGKEDAKPIMKKLKNVDGITASGVTSWADSKIDIHITNKKATKEHAIKKLLELLGSTKGESVGVGDADNDIHLFKSVGLKVAMGNATKNLKNKADIIAEDVKNDGLAKIIKKYSQNKF